MMKNIMGNAVYDFLKVIIAGTLLSWLAQLTHPYIPALKDIASMTIAISSALLFIIAVISYRIYSWGKKIFELRSNSGLFYFRKNKTSDDKRENELFLLNKIKSTKGIEIIGATGFNTFAREDVTNKAFLRNALDSVTGEIKVLLINPGALQAKIRATSLGVPLDVYQEEIMKSIRFLEQLKEKGKSVALKLYDQRPIWKMIILDDFLWLQYYYPCGHVETMPVYGISRNTGEGNYNLFDPLYAIFQKKWLHDSNPVYDFETKELVYSNKSRIKIEEVIKNKEALSAAQT